MMGTTDILILAGVVFALMIGICLVMARLYKRASKEVSFVRTGLGGQKVVMNGGALVAPVLHEIIPVNMNTLRLEVKRNDGQALITHDRMRVDVQAEFYVRVQPTVESIANAAQTLGKRTMQPMDLKELVEGKFVDALRAVAAEMGMEDLHEQRVDFVQKVQAAVSEDILKNGLELESVSLTGLDQTNKEFFNPDNAFDAEGLTKLTAEIEERRKKRNDIEQETEVLIARKNLEAEAQRLEIQRDVEYARLEQEREVQVRQAMQAAQIAQEEAVRKQEADQARIGADQEIRESEIEANRAVEAKEIEKQRLLREQEINKEKAVEAADVERMKQIKLAEQDRDIAVAEKSREKSEADRAADEARAIAAQAHESVVTARDTEIAEREKQIELIEAEKAAQQQAIALTVAAEAEKTAATDRAEAIKIAAEAEANKARIEAEGQATAEKAKAEAMAVTYEAEATGKARVNEAANILSAEQIAMQVKIELINALPAIIQQSVKPMENIDGIKILSVDGLNGAGALTANGDDAFASAQNGSLADQAVGAALRYRTQAPLIDQLMGELGITGGSLAEMTNQLTDKPLANGSAIDHGKGDEH
ncbi:MAG: flotillin domain-containing protein [Pseudomonadota bacterium]